MKITVDVPDKFFHDVINDCEEKAGMHYDGVHESVRQTEHVDIMIAEEDEKLCKWLAALALTDFFNRLNVKPGRKRMNAKVLRTGEAVVVEPLDYNKEVGLPLFGEVDGDSPQRMWNLNELEFEQ